NAASLLLYAAPILTFTRVIKNRSTEEFSCTPYIFALLNCLLYTWYGLPVVSIEWENLPLVTINGLGTILETSFVFIYIYYASPKRKMPVLIMTLSILVVFGISAFASSFALHEHRPRKMLVGTVGMAASATMYSAPLVAVKRVVETKSVKYMPFYLSLFSFLASLHWMTYGLLGHDIILAAPNFVGCPLALLQLVIYFIYRKNKGNMVESQVSDVEKKADMGNPNMTKTQNVDIEKAIIDLEMTVEVRAKDGNTSTQTTNC
ncbi:hypothetical protein AMTR_s00015p00257420, partial [Amborella trichopoda]